jgi:hypothetical protein
LDQVVRIEELRVLPKQRIAHILGMRVEKPRLGELPPPGWRDLVHVGTF